jgi:glycosyltransferase involved in cell wall biosynthesis
MTSFDRLRTALSRLPLAASGAARRFAEDPERAKALARRYEIPGLRRMNAESRRDQRASSVATGVDGAAGADELGFWSAVARDDFDEAVRVAGTDPLRCAAVARLGGCLNEAKRQGVALAKSLPSRQERRRAARVVALATRELAELAPVTFGRSTGTLGQTPGRILHVVTNALPEVQAGYTIRTDHIVRAQLAAGLDPHVVTRPGFPVLQGHLVSQSEVQVHGVPYHRILPALAPSRRPESALRQHVAELTKLVQVLQPQVLHAATGFANGQAALRVRDLTGTRVVYEVRGFLEDSWASRHGGAAAETTDRYQLARARETDVMLAADAVVTLGEAMRAEIISRGVAPERVVLVPNGVDEHFLAPLVDKEQVRRRLGIPAAELVVGLISTLYSHEGVLTLIRAASILRDQDVDVRLVIVGSGPDAAAMHTLVDELRLADRLTAPGQVPVGAVRDWFDALDVFALPRIDSRVTRLVTPLKPVESMARGVPVVASDLPALAEVIGADERGILVSPDDPAALAQGLADLLDDRLRLALGSAAREWVAGCRTWAYATRAYSGAYSGTADEL